MIKKETYHEAYINKYARPHNIQLNKNNNVIFLVFVSLPFIFTLFLNLLFNYNDNEVVVTFDKYQKFPEEIVYNNISENNTLDNKIYKNDDTLLKK